VKEIGHLGRWVLRLAPFKFRVKHTRGCDIGVADALSRIFEGKICEGPELTCASLLESLPLVYSSIESHQTDDPFCKDVRAKLVADPAEVDKFSIFKNLLCYYPKGAKRRRWVVPTLLRPMLIKYFHDSPLAGHLGAFKTFNKVAMNFGGRKCVPMFFDMSETAMPKRETRPQTPGWNCTLPNLPPSHWRNYLWIS
jgi:hypothetical protein